jgi:hypothetical protein
VEEKEKIKMKAKLISMFILHMGGGPAWINFWRRRKNGQLFSKSMYVNTESSARRLDRALQNKRTSFIFADAESLSVNIDLE